jgi:hypothetical protein
MLGVAMGRRTGSADLPLHRGRVPAWLADRMAKLGLVVTEAIILEYGRDEFLRRLANPFWFQSFGAVMGMDWHSSGITTSVLSALKRGLAPVSRELGIFVCGGRGAQSRKTPSELTAVGNRTGLDGKRLGETSRLVAKVDSAAVQDGFELYLHGFVVTADGTWTVIQQGMNAERRQARRYHWLSENLESFVDEPHSAIDGPNQGRIVNLTDRRAAPSRAGQVELVRRGPDRILATLQTLQEKPEVVASPQLYLQMPAHHDVRPKDVFLRRLHGTLAAAADAGPKDFADLLLVPGVGARTVAVLAMVSEVIHGAPYRFLDPARFSLAHGGKDGHPFPVPLRVYDETIQVLRRAVTKAKIGNDDRLCAIRRLDQQARAMEKGAQGPTFEHFCSEERRTSGGYGGRTVYGPAPRLPTLLPRRPKRPRSRAASPQQLSLLNGRGKGAITRR